MKFSGKFSKGMLGTALAMLMISSLTVPAFADVLVSPFASRSNKLILLTATVIFTAVAVTALIIVIYKNKK